MAHPDDDVVANARKAIGNAMLELLETRHLYQQVHVDISSIEKHIASSSPEKLRSVKAVDSHFKLLDSIPLKGIS